MPHHSWIEIEKIIFFLCLLFMAMVYRLIWFQKNIIQLDCSTVNENNLNLSRIWIACQRETYFFELSEFYFWIRALKYMKQKHVSRHTPKFTWRLFFLLLGNYFTFYQCGRSFLKVQFLGLISGFYPWDLMWKPLYPRD